MTFVRVPCNLLGTILDHGRASAYAVHLLAIKASKGSSFVLNERHVAHEYGLSRRAFQIGMRLLKKTKVLERSQSSRRAYATEVLAASSYNYVLIDEGLLKAKSTLVAFILAVNLSPDPLHPSRAARRLGIKTPGTWRKLVHAAVERGDVARTVTGRGATLLARRGFDFDLVKNKPAKNVTAKNDTAHSSKEDSTANGNPSIGEASRADARRRAQESILKEAEAPIILTNWKVGSWYFRDNLQFDGTVTRDVSLNDWLSYLGRYQHLCGVTPPHLQTPAAYVQALEIAHELRQRTSNRLLVPEAMAGIAYALTAVVARGKVVRSLALVALPLVRKTRVGDLTWAFGIPTKLSSEAYQESFGLAFEAATAFKRYDFPATSDYLLSTLEVESLSAKICRYGRATVVQGINAALSDPLARPKEGTVVVRWGWFDQHIEYAHRMRAALRQAERKARATSRKEHRPVPVAK